MPCPASDGQDGPRGRDYATGDQAERIIAFLNQERQALLAHGRRVTLRHEVMLVLLAAAVTLAGSSLVYSARTLAPAIDRNYARLLSTESILKERGITLKLLQRGLWVEQGRREAIQSELAGLRRELDSQDRANRSQDQANRSQTRANRSQNRAIGRLLAGSKRHR